MPDGSYSGLTYPAKLRRIKYHDREHGKTYVFLTNNFALPALTIALLSYAEGISVAKAIVNKSILAMRARKAALFAGHGVDDGHLAPEDLLIRRVPEGCLVDVAEVTQG